MRDIQRVYERLVVTHDKHATADLDKVEKRQAAELAGKHKKLRSEHAKQKKKLKQESADALKVRACREKQRRGGGLIV